MANILETILRRKKEEISERQRLMPFDRLINSIDSAPQPRGFMRSITRTTEAGAPAVIAEIKKASPSKGVIRESFDPVAIAESYKIGGATCLSVLTDIDFFQGSDAYFEQVRLACTLPLIRKDFIIEAYQVYESRVLGADCLLLIVSALTKAKLVQLSTLASQLGMDVLVEVHNRRELETALLIGAEMIGINNRNLTTFETTLDTTYGLLEFIPHGSIVVTESGIQSRSDVLAMRTRGVNAFLVGEAFMRKDNPGLMLKNLFSL